MALAFHRIATIQSKIIRLYTIHRHSALLGTLPKCYGRHRSVGLKKITIWGGNSFLAFSLFPLVHALYKKEDAMDGSQQHALKDEELIGLADRLYNEYKIHDLYDLMATVRDTKNPEILWRLGRACYERGQLEGKFTEAGKVYVREAHGYLSRGLEEFPNCSGMHRYYACMLDLIGSYQGHKQRIANSYIVKKHFLRAIELDPSDSISLFSLGYWCYSMADLAWYKRQLASILFATPPTSTYEEAFEYFKRAEKANPGFYSMNLVMLGKMYDHFGDREMALQFLRRARDHKGVMVDDDWARREAKEQLKKMRYKE